MTLSRREGVDIRPTLLRVLTDLYVQASAHSERRGAAVRRTDLPPDRPGRRRDARGRSGAACDLSGHAGRGPEKARAEARSVRISACRSPPRSRQHLPRPPPVKTPSEAQLRMASNLSMQPKDAAEINDMFFRASSSERALDPAQSRRHAVAGFAREFPPRAPARAIETLEMAAFAADVENFTLELGETLILPSRVAAQVGQRSRRRAAGLRGQGAGHAEPGFSARAAVSQA